MVQIHPNDSPIERVIEWVQEGGERGFAYFSHFSIDSKDNRILSAPKTLIVERMDAAGDVVA